MIAPSYLKPGETNMRSERMATVSKHGELIWNRNLNRTALPRRNFIRSKIIFNTLRSYSHSLWRTKRNAIFILFQKSTRRYSTAYLTYTVLFYLFLLLFNIEKRAKSLILKKNDGKIFRPFLQYYGSFIPDKEIAVSDSLWIMLIERDRYSK